MHHNILGGNTHHDRTKEGRHRPASFHHPHGSRSRCQAHDRHTVIAGRPDQDPTAGDANATDFSRYLPSFQGRQGQRRPEGLCERRRSQIVLYRAVCGRQVRDLLVVVGRDSAIFRVHYDAMIVSFVMRRSRLSSKTRRRLEGIIQPFTRYYS